MKSNGVTAVSKKSLFIRFSWQIMALSLLTTSIIALPVASAHELNIFSVSGISVGRLDPAPIIEGVGFSPDLDKFDFTLDMGKTNLEFDSVAYIDSFHVRFNFHGTANTGTISISAETTAFNPIAEHSSNSIKMVIAAPLLTQTITFKAPTSMVVGEKDQIPIASSTSFLDVSIVSNTPSVCTIDFSKIHAVAAGTCSIKASQSGNSDFAAASEVTRTLQITSNSYVNAVQTKAETLATNLGSQIYDPASADGGYVSVLVAGTNGSFGNASLIKIIIPSQATSEKAVILVSAFSSDEETAAGYFVARVAAVSSSGTTIKEFDKSFEVNMPAGAIDALPYYSHDGVTWSPITKIDTEELPAELNAGYFVESDGRIAILTKHFMLIGLREPQRVFTITTPVLKLEVSSTAVIRSYGGSGYGEVSFRTSNEAMCTISTLGVITGVRKGSCLISADKGASGTFAQSSAQQISILITESGSELKSIAAAVNTGFFTHSLTFMKLNSTQTLEVGLCSIYANEKADLFLGTKGQSRTWTWSKISTAPLDEHGTGVFSITRKFSAGQKVRVMVNGVIQMESDI